MSKKQVMFIALFGSVLGWGLGMVMGSGISLYFMMDKPSHPTQEIHTCAKCEWLDGLTPKLLYSSHMSAFGLGLSHVCGVDDLSDPNSEILSSSQMSYFATRESYEKMTMHDLLSVYKTAGTASTDEFYNNLLGALNDPKRHGSPFIADYRFSIWMRIGVLSDKWCPNEKEERRTLTYEELEKVLSIINPHYWMFDHSIHTEAEVRLLEKPYRTASQTLLMENYMLDMSDWIMLQGTLKNEKTTKGKK